MKIALCSIGSRGDVQPFLVLGEYLSQQGYQVKVSSAKMFQALASNYDLEYVPFAGNYELLINNEALKKEIGRNPFTLRKQLKKKVYPIMESSLQTFYELIQWADIVLYHPKTLIDSIGYQMQHKLIKAYVVPAFTPTEAFPNPILMFLPLPAFLNKLTYKFANAMIGTVKTPIINFKRKNNLEKSRNLLDTPIIYGISPSFVNRPKDYPVHHHFSGFWIKENTIQELSSKVKAFLSDQKKVLIITFGSMPYQSNIDINDFTDSILKQEDIKILIVKAWGLKDIDIEEHENQMAIDSAPFDLLFPLADYIIHHGGAGTTATALRAGIPQFICPVLHPFGDQYYWGKQVEQTGVGVKPIPLKRLNIRNLLASVQELRSEQLCKNALTLSKKIKTEDGLLKVKEILEEHFD